ncbi:hypothetical protein [Streptomyces morookaense]|uniref:Integral membrane protein n=1 Tax=Streptomyces morookaense TaxID=1970 RepID=A0A7Y7B4A0_STRMO|nr:hypothetical protein [Streptomyces morookaense]NVK78773.1 hypothetical protein [Streptomyces morookaense]GHF34643.1 hypothetical protein GCM10010359_41410 [Streptomyces morookaense]
MTGRADTDDAADDKGRHRPERPRTDYGGAVYGALLAASVVAGTGALGPYHRVGLVVILLVTGLVFWAAHAYSRLVGERDTYRHPTWAVIGRVARDEWPIFQAAVPPALAVAISPLLGLDLEGTAWFALSVALAEQIGWAGAAEVRAGGSRRRVLASGVVNLVLGLVIVILKAFLHEH